MKEDPLQSVHRDTFILFINYMEAIHNLKAERLQLKSITQKQLCRFLSGFEPLDELSYD